MRQRNLYRASTVLAGLLVILLPHPVFAQQNNSIAFIIKQKNTAAAVSQQSDQNLQKAKSEFIRVSDLLEKEREKNKSLKGRNEFVVAEKKKSDERIKTLERERDDVGAQVLQVLRLLDPTFARDSQYVEQTISELPDGARGSGLIDTFLQGDKRSREIAIAAAEEMERSSELQAAQTNRQTALLMYESMQIGDLSIRKVIPKYEQVVTLDSTNAGDWARLTNLYRDANLLDNAVEAAQKSYALENDGTAKAIALIALANAQMMKAGEEMTYAEFSKSVQVLCEFFGKDHDFGSEDQIARAIAEKGEQDAIIELMAGVKAIKGIVTIIEAPTEIATAHKNYELALSLLEKELPSLARDIEIARVNIKLSETSLLLWADDVSNGWNDYLKGLDVVVEKYMALLKRRSELDADQYKAEESKIEAFAKTLRDPTKMPIEEWKHSSLVGKHLEATANLTKLLESEYPDSLEVQRVSADAATVWLQVLSQFSAGGQEKKSLSENELAILEKLRNRIFEQRNALVNSAPENLAYRLELARAYESAGMHASTFAMPEKSAGYFRQFHEICSSLARADEGSATFARCEVEALTRMISTKDPAFGWDRVVEQYKLMRKKGLLAPTDEKFITIANEAQTAGPKCMTEPQ